MIVDCDTCEVRGHACGDCVIGVLLGVPSPRSGEFRRSEEPPGAPIVQLDAPERRALDVLAEQGLVPRLRLVEPQARRATTTSDGEGHVRDAG